MKQYEYTIHPLLARGRRDAYTIDVIMDGGYRDINDMGRDGWKLAGVIEDQYDPGTQLGVFVRRVVDAGTTQPLASQQVEGSTVTWSGEVPSDTSCEVTP